jgi:hypothetical protein
LAHIYNVRVYIDDVRVTSFDVRAPSQVSLVVIFVPFPAELEKEKELLKKQVERTLFSYIQDVRGIEMG